MTRGELTDRERILLTIVRGLASTQLLARGMHYNAEDFRCSRTDPSDDSLYTHFAYYQKDLKPGDLVIGATARAASRWQVAWLVKPIRGGWLVRELGGKKLCNYTNENFVPIVGLDPLDVLEGAQRRFLGRVMSAFKSSRRRDYHYLFGGLRFDGSDAVVTVREWFGRGSDSVPFDVRMPWGPRTSAKAILEALRAGGVGTKSFKPEVTS